MDERMDQARRGDQAGNEIFRQPPGHKQHREPYHFIDTPVAAPIKLER